ncbi:thiamine-phosphate kinase [Aestuariimicrobium kwangyangense]|uniref:thiamine-phosphate kinase n=1 Tax=Aestuariimicrobium kwangyangense TaxID=396389 RepID=UPI0003B6CEC1|nr:thiamine-phosphate kinase [Aestuariimicrobium kwangyangense]
MQTIAELGEFGLIEVFTRDLGLDAAVSVGPGDDAAVFLVNGSAVCSTDLLVEGVHFRTDWSGGADVGRKCVAVNVADLEAMGATPVSLVVALGAPASTPLTWVRQFMTGMREEAQTAGVTIVGGDTTAAERITVCVTVVGQTEGRAPVLRSGARPGQVVAMVGRLGWAAAGLAVLKRGFRSPRAVVEAQRTPQVPYRQGRRAAEAGATAMCDVSDGLVGDLTHLANASGVVIDVDTSRLVVAEPLTVVAQATGSDPLSFVLTGGEDHALVACFEPGFVPDDWHVIGRVLPVQDDGRPAVLVDGEPFSGPGGYDHFA